MDKIKNINDILERQSYNLPKKTFIIFGKKKMTFRKVEVLSSALSSYLYDLGVRAGSRVCIWMYNCPEFVISYFAIFRLGAIAVPINSMFRREEAHFVAEDSEAEVMICSSDKIDDAVNIRARVGSLNKILSFSFDADKFPRIGDLAGIFSSGRKFSTEKGINPDDTAEILYTSGTTGKPKGVCLTHKNLISNVRGCCQVIRASSRDTFICLLPLFHSFASTVCMLLPLYLGCSTVIFRVIRPFKRVLRSVMRNRVTIFVGVPSLFNVLKNLKIPRFLNNFLLRIISPLRVCISGAAALPKNVISEFEKKFRTPLLEGYGLTEASPVVSLSPLKGKRVLGSIGLPLPSVKVKVVSPEGKRLGVNQRGELIVKGPNIMKGYFKLEEETKKAIVDGWLYTGDSAFIDEEGYIFITGRIKDMINVRGLNVYPREIEDLLYQLPYIKESAVIGVSHPRKGEVPIAVVSLEENEKRDVLSKEILNFLKIRLAEFKVPFKIIFRSELPKNAAGKIVKYVLKEEIERELFSPKIKNNHA